jgi:hypothetical protein
MANRHFGKLSEVWKHPKALRLRRPSCPPSDAVPLPDAMFPRGFECDPTLYSGGALEGRLPYAPGTADALARALGLDGEGGCSTWDVGRELSPWSSRRYSRTSSGSTPTPT